MLWRLAYSLRNFKLLRSLHQAPRGLKFSFFHVKCFYFSFSKDGLVHHCSMDKLYGG